MVLAKHMRIALARCRGAMAASALSPAPGNLRAAPNGEDGANRGAGGQAKLWVGFALPTGGKGARRR